MRYPPFIWLRVVFCLYGELRPAWLWVSDRAKTTWWNFGVQTLTRFFRGLLAIVTFCSSPVIDDFQRMCGMAGAGWHISLPGRTLGLKKKHNHDVVVVHLLLCPVSARLKLAVAAKTNPREGGRQVTVKFAGSLALTIDYRAVVVAVVLRAAIC